MVITAYNENGGTDSTTVFSFFLLYNSFRQDQVWRHIGGAALVILCITGNLELEKERMREAGLVKEFRTIYAEYKSIGKEVYFLEDKIKIQHANSLLYMRINCFMGFPTETHKLSGTTSPHPSPLMNKNKGA